MDINLKNVSDEDKGIIQHIKQSHGFEDLKNTQKQAFEDDIMDDGNQLLVAETGNGKTLCAEALVKKNIEQGNKVAYLVPSTQLVGSKKESINEWIGDDVTVSSGSGKYHHGDVVVATFSSFYQAVLRGVGGVRSFDLAVLDDFHELYGSFIGPGLEKSIAAIKQYDIEIFSMSATIGNPEEISSWLDADLTVSDEKRSIPIEEEVVSLTSSSKKKSLVNFVDRISDKEPILVFNYAKSWTESRAKGIADKGTFEGPDIDVEEKLRDIVDGSLPTSLQDLAEMIENGVAYHHSSLPRNVRKWIEELYKNRQISCLCATTTIAYGFDSPVQTVVVADMKRRGSWVGKWEYQQWIGRAARPGYGYDKGYAYVLTNDERTVRDEFFEPRELEDVTTHVDSPEEFRKLILELVVMGWETPEEIEEFVEETLYWNQLSTEGAWGKSFKTQNKRLKRKLRESADWLEDRNFIREDRTSTRFESTELGEGAVEFIFDSNISPTLSEIHDLYKWAESRDKTEPLEMLGRTCEIFGLGVRQKSSSTHIESVIHGENMNVNGNTITAAVLHEYWIENYEMDQIEKEAQINSTYLTSTSYRISTTLEATNHITQSTRLHVPNWLDTYSYRLQRGIELDAVPYVRNVRGLGRSRVRKLRDHLSTQTQLTSENDDGKSIWELTENCLDDADEDMLIEDISENVSGIGERIATRLVEYHRENHIPDLFRERNSSSRGGSGNTKIGDFGN